MALWTGIPGGGHNYQLPDKGNDVLGNPLRCLAKSVDFERKLAIRMPFSESKEDPQHSSRLLNLPAEVIWEIFDSLQHAPSQIALGISCKRLARLAQEVKLCLTQTSAKYAGFLPVSVFDVPDLMAQLRPWMPESLKMCGHCLTYRPISSEYWNAIPGHRVNDFWIQKVGWRFQDARWWKQTHNICPACHGTCTLSDYIDCDGCRALGRLGDVDWSTARDPQRTRGSG